MCFGSLSGKLCLAMADVALHGARREVHDPQRDLVDPAVKGTKNILSAVAKSKDTVQRVVLTSSFAAVVKGRAGPSNGKVFTEEDWNDESSLTDEPYRFSKVGFGACARMLHLFSGL